MVIFLKLGFICFFAVVQDEIALLITKKEICNLVKDSDQFLNEKGAYVQKPNKIIATDNTIKLINLFVKLMTINYKKRFAILLKTVISF